MTAQAALHLAESTSDGRLQHLQAPTHLSVTASAVRQASTPRGAGRQHRHPSGSTASRRSLRQDSECCAHRASDGCQDGSSPLGADCSRWLAGYMLSWHLQMPGSGRASKQQQHSNSTVARPWLRRGLPTQGRWQIQQQFWPHSSWRGSRAACHRVPPSRVWRW
jgi:hypothetical protein